MAQETERKFLVKQAAWDALEKPRGAYLKQSYLLNTATKTVRVRQTDTEGYITIKGATEGITRTEFEYAIPRTDAGGMLDQFCDDCIEKIRYKIPVGKHVFDVDVFMGKLAGLVLAEVELHDAAEAFIRPDWLGQEVSYDARYYNAVLIQAKEVPTPTAE